MKLQQINAVNRHSSNMFSIHSDTQMWKTSEIFSYGWKRFCSWVCLAVGFVPYSAIYDLSFQPLFGKCLSWWRNWMISEVHQKLPNYSIILMLRTYSAQEATDCCMWRPAIFPSVTVAPKIAFNLLQKHINHFLSEAASHSLLALVCRFSFYLDEVVK